MIRSMYSGISGMKNFQTKLDVIGNNISNVNTYGFKKGRVTFQDLMNQTVSGASSATETKGGQNPKQIGLGGTLATVDLIDTQGSLQTTGRSLDVAISGDGYFVTRMGTGEAYTRAGNFYLDSEGQLVTGNGSLVQGFSVDGNGNIDRSTLTDITIDTDTTMAPQATEEASFDGNLKASSNTDVVIDFKVKDSLGQDIELKLTLTNQGSNSWGYAVTTANGNVALTSNTGNISFSNTGEYTGGNATLSMALTNNASSPQDIELDFSKLTQFDSTTSANVETIDGNAEGYLESFNISSSGEVNGIFSNGEVRVLSQLVIATFSNGAGLQKTGENMYITSNNSGLPNYGIASEGRGSLQSGALEMSNVDLSEEFTEMIVAQRGFQANTRIITTSDEILQELVNLKR
ncbi:flagellar hook protein FlgE [Bacillus spongiae]|uniref:Flagellar hook protein FlgE n=1 Tax=Bacillus spongiae TaxID=2683610 RepID=A0ABU8HAK3_9BACI